MAETETKTPPVTTQVETPTDSPPSPSNSPPPKRKVPQRGKRKRVLGSGEGDFCIMQISDNKNFPKGTLLTIPETPRFESLNLAKRWVIASSGDRLAGMKVMIFKAYELFTIRINTEPTVTVEARPKIEVPSKTAETVE